MKKPEAGILYALLAALCFASIPAFVKSAYSEGVGVLTLLAIRYLLASAVLVPAVLVRGRGAIPQVGQLLKIMAAAGILLGLEAALYFSALTMLPSAVACLVLFTFPIFVNIAGLIRGHRLSTTSWLSLLACLGGMVALLGPDFRLLNGLGVLLAFLAAVAYAAYLLLIDRFTVGVEPAVTNAAVSVANAVTMLGASLVFGGFRLGFQPSAWIAIVLIVLVSNLAGFQFFFLALKRLGANRVSVLNMAEPLFTTLIAVSILGERLSLPQSLGAAVMIGGLFVFAHGKSLEVTRSHSPIER